MVVSRLAKWFAIIRKVLVSSVCLNLGLAFLSFSICAGAITKARTLSAASARLSLSLIGPQPLTTFEFLRQFNPFFKFHN